VPAAAAIAEIVVIRGRGAKLVCVRWKCWLGGWRRGRAKTRDGGDCGGAVGGLFDASMWEQKTWGQTWRGEERRGAGRHGS
jgi:hypothetical protein